jgi:hypothetical protein
MFQIGDFIILNNQVGVVVRTGAELGEDMEDHTGVWFGTCEDNKPEVWTVPSEYLHEAPSALMKH